MNRLISIRKTESREQALRQSTYCARRKLRLSEHMPLAESDNFDGTEQCIWLNVICVFLHFFR